MPSTSESPVQNERAARYLDEIAGPRLTGTERERKTADKIEEHFRALGFHVIREQFEFGSMGRWLTKILVALLPASLFVSLLLLDKAPFLSFLISLAVLLLFSYMTRNSSKIAWLGNRWGKKTGSQNVVASKEPQQEERAHLILGAHYDSKSLARSIYPNHYVMEVVFLPTFLISAGFLAMIGAVGLISAVSGFVAPTVAVTVCLWFSGVLALLFLTYITTGYGDDSDGSSDNASGVAVLMELAHLFDSHSLEHLKISFAAFGAEELGLLGSNFHFFNHRYELEDNRAYMISIDMPAAKGTFGYNEKYGIPPPKNGFLSELFDSEIGRPGWNRLRKDWNGTRQRLGPHAFSRTWSAGNPRRRAIKGEHQDNPHPAG